MSYIGMVMHIVDAEGNIIHKDIHKDIYENCDESKVDEFAKNLAGEGWNNVSYDYIPLLGGCPALNPDLQRPDDGLNYFSPCYIKIKDYDKWFRDYAPHVDAGWVTTYEKWLYETKNIIPRDLSHYLDKDANKDDIHFIEVVDENDPAYYLFLNLGKYKTSSAPIAEHYLFMYFYNN
jgi:hypothetical protein